MILFSFHSRYALLMRALVRIMSEMIFREACLPIVITGKTAITLILRQSARSTLLAAGPEIYGASLKIITLHFGVGDVAYAGLLRFPIFVTATPRYPPPAPRQPWSRRRHFILTNTTPRSVSSKVYDKACKCAVSSLAH